MADFVIYNKLSLTVETGAELTISTPVIYDYQIGDGLVMSYEDFISALTSGGFTTDAQKANNQFGNALSCDTNQQTQG